MISCPTCGKENEDFFRFCLGCGSDLEAASAPAAAKAEPAPEAAPRRATPAHAAPVAPAAAVDTEPAVPAAESADAPQKKPTAPAQASATSAAAHPRETTAGAEAARAAQQISEPLVAGAVPPGSTVDPSTEGPKGRAPAPPPPGGVRARPPVAAPPRTVAARSAGPEIERKPRAQARVGGGTMLRPTSLEPISQPIAGECRVCGAPSQPDFAFCASCGAPLAEARAAATPAKPRSGVARGRIVLIREDGSDGDAFELDAGGTTLGRDGGHINFAEDDFLAARHAELAYRNDALWVTPLETTNGVFIRLLDEVEIEPGDAFRVGQELLRFDVYGDLSGRGQDLDEEGTLRLGSPLPTNVWGRLSQLVGPDSVGNAYVLVGDETYIGRERGDIVFPDDGYVSGMHAMLTRREDSVVLKDMGSSNGTYVRIREAVELRPGDFVLAGQQLFRADP
ncbi:MAG: FHA domain-containing protein [Myxococcota bacterium]